MVTLRLSKEYDTPVDDSPETIEGTITLADEAAVEQFRKDFAVPGKVQTVDPRIEWEYEPGELWEYIDYSFEIVGQDTLRFEAFCVQAEDTDSLAARLEEIARAVREGLTSGDSWLVCTVESEA
jgi:hypothetical protein